MEGIVLKGNMCICTIDEKGGYYRRNVNIFWLCYIVENFIFLISHVEIPESRSGDEPQSQ